MITVCLRRASRTLKLPCFVLAAAAASVLLAQNGHAEWADTEVKRLLAEAPVTQAYREAGAVILLKEVRVKVEKDGAYTLTGHVVGKIIDAKAASDYSEMTFGYNSFYADGKLLRARTIQEDGTIRNISGDAVQIKTTPEGRTYTDIRLLTFSLPALAQGSVFEYEYAVHQHTPIMQGAYSEDVFFNLSHNARRADPVRTSRFILEAPGEFEVVKKADNVRLTEDVVRRPSATTYTWEARDIPGVAYCSNMPPADLVAPHIHVTTIKTWQQIAQWATGLLSPSIEASDRMVASKARELTKDAKNDDERIEALFYFMEEHIKYVAADLDRGGFAPHPAHEVLKSLYGDCKDQAILFVSLLRALNIEAYPALISTFGSKTTEEAIPAPDFNHVIVYIPRPAGGLWLDTTSEVNRFPRLYWINQGRSALLVDAQKGRLMKTAGPAPEENEGRMTVTGYVRDRTLYFDVNVEAKGALGDVMKMLLRPLSPENQKEATTSALKNLFTGQPDVKNVRVAGLREARTVFSLSGTIEISNGWNPEMTTYTQLHSLKPVLDFFPMVRDFPQPDHRRYGYQSLFPVTLVMESILSAPEPAMAISSIPPAESLDTPYISFTARYAKDGRSIRSSSRLIQKTSVLDNAQYKQFYADYREAVSKSGTRLVWVKRQGGAQSEELEEAVSKSPESVPALLALAKDYLRRAKYKEAKDLLEKSIAAEPQNGEANYLLGISCGYLNRRDESKKALNRAKELGYRP